MSLPAMFFFDRPANRNTSTADTMASHLPNSATPRGSPAMGAACMMSPETMNIQHILSMSAPM